MSDTENSAQDTKVDNSLTGQAARIAALEQTVHDLLTRGMGNATGEHQGRLDAWYEALKGRFEKAL